MPRSKGALFWPVLLAVTGADVLTKGIAVHWLVPQHLPHEVLGDAVRFTLVYNPGAAFGLFLGGQSRWIFTALTVLALGVLARLYWKTPPGHVQRILALALVCGGAIGNLLDRLRSGMGVVDFIDVGLRDARWPTFNVADMAVSVGAVLLAWVLWAEDHQASSVMATPVPGEQPGEAS
ncbi:MAG TPA: signal peptidase II [Gemmatimonadaceae bacterium]|nr:signal peptidase II [Gemmatimonadaceae bacterium]